MFPSEPQPDYKEKKAPGALVPGAFFVGRKSQDQGEETTIEFSTLLAGS
jgi:hypothetical protein